jgi:hypothetical protein
MNANAEPAHPLCFVAMPFGTRQDANGTTIDFDTVYSQLIRPAVEAAQLEPLRGDEERFGGLIHKPIFERLILCDYAVADLTTANANVYYELGIRHAVRPRSTVMVFAESMRLPFDVGPVRGIPYRLTKSGRLADVERTLKALASALREARRPATDSPIFQLLGEMRPPDISHLKTDTFRDRVTYSVRRRAALAIARQTAERERNAEAIRAFEKSLSPLADEEAALLVDLLLSYRAVSAWSDMIGLVERLPEHVARTVMIREQYGFALNRAGRSEDAETTLLDLVREHGPSSETLGILGRVYKDRWQAALTRGQAAHAQGFLRKAIATYLEGFETDWRDAYPGWNAVELMSLCEPPDERLHELIPVVTYSVRRRLERDPRYWDHATLLGLQILAEDRLGAARTLADALACRSEEWDRKSTADSLARIAAAGERRAVDVSWVRQIEERLRTAP